MRYATSECCFFHMVKWSRMIRHIVNKPKGIAHILINLLHILTQQRKQFLSGGSISMCANLLIANNCMQNYANIRQKKNRANNTCIFSHCIRSATTVPRKEEKSCVNMIIIILLRFDNINVVEMNAVRLEIGHAASCITNNLHNNVEFIYKTNMYG